MIECACGGRHEVDRDGGELRRVSGAQGVPTRFRRIEQGVAEGSEIRTAGQSGPSPWGCPGE